MGHKQDSVPKHLATNGTGYRLILASMDVRMCPAMIQ